MPRSDFESLINDVMRDVDDRIDGGERDRALEAAVLRYSDDAPQSLVRDVTAAGGNDLVLPSEWVDGWSRLQSIEYPIGAGLPEFLRADAYGIYEAPSGVVARLLHAATAGEIYRLSFTARHVLDAASDTIPQSHRLAVASLAASYLLQQLATVHAADTDNLLGGAQVDHGDKSGRYRRQAGALAKRYFETVGVDPAPATAPAGTVVNWDASDQRGRDRLVHGRAYR